MSRHDITSVLASDRRSTPRARLSRSELRRVAKKVGMSEAGQNWIESFSEPPGVSIIDDQPARRDKFGFSRFIRTLADITLSESTQTPITVAIDGEWGTGKTSILQMLERQAQLVGCPCIWLNAWVLENPGDFIAAADDEIRRAAGALDGGIEAGIQIPLDGPPTTSEQSYSMAGASAARAKRSFAKLVSGLLQSAAAKGTSSPLLLVFIDDLDRALPDQIANILRTLKVIVESPQCVFVIAMDTTIVAEAIAHYYRALDIGESDGGSRRFGNSYLEKLVQIRLKVPQLTRGVVADYLDEIGFAKEIQEIIAWAPSSVVTNPRRVKQYLNWLSINLQLIVGSSLPAGVSNAAALRAAAFRLSYPGIYGEVLQARNEREALLIVRGRLQESEFLLMQEAPGQDFDEYWERIVDPNTLRLLDEGVFRAILGIHPVEEIGDAELEHAVVSGADAQPTIVSGKQARSAILRGVSMVADVVRKTLGPRGRYIALEKTAGGPELTRRGIQIARSIEVEDPVENVGVYLMREAAEETYRDVRDGVATTLAMTEEIVKTVMERHPSGASLALIRKGIGLAADAAIQFVTSMSESVVELAELTKVQGGRDFAIVIAEAMEKVGKDGVITIEEGSSLVDELDVVEGMQFDRGYLSPYFINNQQSQSAELEDPYILLHDKKISNIRDLLPVLEAVAKAGRPLLIVAEDVEGEALATLVVNAVRGIIKVCAVKALGFGDRRKAMLQDIAILTGATVISEEVGLSLEKAGLAELGTAKKVQLTKEETTIIDGAGSEADIKGRVEQIRGGIEETTSDYDKEKLQERLAKLAGGVAVIKVGGVTESEVKEKMLLAEDALHAMRAAVEEGVVPGGGVALLRAIAAVDEIKVEREVQSGVQAVRRALEVPAAQIIANAGYPAAAFIPEIMNQENQRVGFNAITGELEDLVAAGITDPTRVLITCLRKTVATVERILSTEAWVSSKSEVEPAQPALNKSDSAETAM
jgi:chaperonin GroEL